MIKSSPQPVLLTGANGRLGLSLRRHLPSDIALSALSHSELDITDSAQVAHALRELRPAVIINAAAFIAVDGTDGSAAHAVNRDGPRLLAQSAAQAAARLIHISTDYVFDGEFGDESPRPYTPQDRPRPLSAYGHGKLAGERAALSAHPQGTLVLRSAWLYDAHSQNFATGMLARMGTAGRVAASDQVGSPTWLPNLVAAIWSAVRRPAVRGLLHYCDEGAVTRHTWVTALSEIGASLGVLPAPVPVDAAMMRDFNSAQLRPRYSALDSSDAVRALGQPTMPWREGVARMLRGYRASMAECKSNL